MSESSFTVNCTLQCALSCGNIQETKDFRHSTGKREHAAELLREREQEKLQVCNFSNNPTFFFLFKFHIYIFFLYSPCSLPLGRARSGAHAALSPSVQERITRNVSRSSDRFPPYVLTFVGWINPRPRT